MGTFKKIIKPIGKIFSSASDGAEVLGAYAKNAKDEAIIECAAHMRKTIRKLINKHGIEEARKILEVAYEYKANKSVIKKVFEEISKEFENNNSK